eukprot:COSAG02_NODE_2963_length_7646_cov_10.941036_3_plen_388_part_00
MPRTETQFFLSSAVSEDVNAGHTRFRVGLEPPMKIEGSSARMFVHSATIPYTFPNITASNSQLIVDVGPGTTTITVPVGVYSLQDLEDAINKQVNAHMHTQGLALLVDGAGKANFVKLEPNARLNRVEATFAHVGTGMDCSSAASTLRTVLGFDALIGYSDPVITVTDSAPLSVSVTVTTDSGPSTVTATANNGTHTASQLLTEINGVVKTATSGALSNFLSSLTVAPSEYVAGEYTAQFAYGAPTGLPSAVFTAAQNASVVAAFGGLGSALRASRWTGQGPSHVATGAAQIDKVTELAVALPGVTHGAYNTAGDATTAVIARFPVTGAPGDLITFAPDVPLYSNVDHLLGTAVSTLEVQLCDQHGAELESLQDEHFSIVLCVQVDT